MKPTPCTPSSLGAAHGTFPGDVRRGDAGFRVRGRQPQRRCAHTPGTDELANELAELPVNNWLEAFRIGLEQPGGEASELITFENLVNAIAAYENSQVFTATPFRDYVQGDDAALTGDAKLGGILFFGEAGCASCHTGDFFTDEAFHIIAFLQVGPGKGDDNGVNADDDFGRFRETGLEADRYAFRTPSLLNVTETGPYGHAGAYASLEAVIAHHANPRSSIENFDLNQLDPGTQADNLGSNTGFALEKLEGVASRRVLAAAPNRVDQRGSVLASGIPCSI